jgi:hypothetical protein
MGETQVTIAGDPYQLGPTVRSNYARINGLEKYVCQATYDKKQIALINIKPYLPVF